MLLGFIRAGRGPAQNRPKDEARVGVFERGLYFFVRRIQISSGLCATASSLLSKEPAHFLALGPKKSLLHAHHSRLVPRLLRQNMPRSSYDRPSCADLLKDATTNGPWRPIGRISRVE